MHIRAYRAPRAASSGAYGRRNEQEKTPAKNLAEALAFSFITSWKKLDVSIWSLDTLGPISGRLDALEDLRLTFAPSLGYLEYSYTEPLTMFQVAPLLRRVEINQKTGMPADLRLPWKTITHLTVDLCNYGSNMRQLEILADCATLTQLHLCNVPIDRPGAFNSVILPKLIVLSVKTMHIHALNPILRSMELPALTLLDLTSFYGWSGVDQLSIVNLVSRSQCSLTSLKLNHLDFVIPSLRDFLNDSRSSSITELGLTASKVLFPHLAWGSTSFPRAIQTCGMRYHSTASSSSQNSTILAGLTKLEISRVEDESSFYEILVMIESRSPAPRGYATLQEVLVEICFKESRIEASKMDRVEMLRDSGLSLVITGR
ncbi:hypothetical protein C8J56DRAFT_1095262 [Mycena floridula]|nr:hypothetical protein C8J56DRAFT_1095262 [Mycena floridula]